jgi:hypothetical protein
MNATSADPSWTDLLVAASAALKVTFSLITTVLFYVLYPVGQILVGCWYILVSLSSPFVYIGGVIVQVALIPWRIFASFEVGPHPYFLHCQRLTARQPVWYFLGSAVLIGLALAIVLHFILRACIVVLRLDKKPPPKAIPPTGHDAISYRKAREEKKRKRLYEQERLAAQARLLASQPLLQEAVKEARKIPLAGMGTTSPLSPVSPTNTLPARPGLLQETILEHSEEDDDDSVF